MKRKEADRSTPPLLGPSSRFSGEGGPRARFATFRADRFVMHFGQRIGDGQSQAHAADLTRDAGLVLREGVEILGSTGDAQ
jgi:hypothetical protein